MSHFARIPARPPIRRQLSDPLPQPKAESVDGIGWEKARCSKCFEEQFKAMMNGGICFTCDWAIVKQQLNAKSWCKKCHREDFAKYLTDGICITCRFLA